MLSEAEITMIQKAAMYDLIEILETTPEKSYTPEEMKKIIRAYISGKEK